jgi:hypothetical protein
MEENLCNKMEGNLCNKMEEEQNVNASLDSLSRKPFSTMFTITNNMCKVKHY